MKQRKWWVYKAASGRKLNQSENYWILLFTSFHLFLHRLTRKRNQGMFSFNTVGSSKIQRMHRWYVVYAAACRHLLLISIWLVVNWNCICFQYCQNGTQDWFSDVQSTFGDQTKWNHELLTRCISIFFSMPSINPMEISLNLNWFAKLWWKSLWCGRVNDSIN